MKPLCVPLLFLAILCWLSLPAHVAALTIDCTAFDNGLNIGYNLTALMNNTGNYIIVHETSTLHHRYYLNVCRSLVTQPISSPSNGSCNWLSPACQVDTFYATELPKTTGLLANPPTIDANGTLSINYTGGDVCPAKGVARNTILKFYCGEGVGVGYPTFYMEDDSCDYYFNWTTSYACKRHCTISPCQNGGTCSENPLVFAQGYNCSCPVGFSGTNCETNINDCAPGSCQNGGQCIDLVNSFSCNCSGTGFQGNSCEINIDDCPLGGCNNGTCIDGVNAYSCNCTGTGYSGTHCENLINFCASTGLCKNGGTCVNGISSYTCNCPSTFRGSRCETPAPTPNPTEVNPSVSPFQGREIAVTGTDFVDGFTCTVDDGAGFQVQVNITSISRSGDTVTFKFKAPIYNATGYVPLVFRNPSGTFFQYKEFYYTDDCPSEGEWGRGLECVPCPDGAVCPGGWRIWPKPGYWNPDETTVPLRCADPSSRCVGGKDSACSDGYTGTLCAQCAPNYYSQGSLCISCEQKSVADIAVRFSVDIVFTVLLAISFLFLRGRAVRRLVIVMAALQMVRTALRILESHLPGGLLSVTSVFAILVGDINDFVNPSCIIDNGSFFVPFWINFGSLLGAQFLIAILLPLKYYLVEVRSKRPKSGSGELTRQSSSASSFSRVSSLGTGNNDLVAGPYTPPPKDPRVASGADFPAHSPSLEEKEDHWAVMKRHLWASWIRASMILLLFTFSNMAHRTFQVTLCVRVFDSYVLATNPSLPCFHGYHTAAFVIGLLVLLIYIIGLPLSLLVIVVRYHLQGRLQEKGISRIFGYIYDSFLPNGFFTGVLWVVVLLFQGLSFALENFALAALLISVLPLGFFAIFLGALRPFRRQVVNYLSISLIVFVIVIEIFSYVHVDQTAYYVTAIVFFGACMLIVIPLVVVPIGSYLHNVYYLKIKSKLQGSESPSKDNLVISDMKVGGGLAKRTSSKQASQMEMTLFSPSSGN